MPPPCWRRSAGMDAMPTLREVQDAIYRSVVERDDGPAARHVAADALAAEARLAVYRNTFAAALTATLRIAFPAVHRLVGADFFETAARLFIEAEPPRSAWLDSYGVAFPDFLDAFRPAASLPYLPGVARLEWAVNVALRTPDVPPLDLSRLATLDPADQERVVLVPSPAIGLVRADHPVDTIWQAVLAQDDAAMEEVALDSGAVHLLVDRADDEVTVERIDPASWRLLSALCRGEAVSDALAVQVGVEGAALLARHLAAGRFVRFELIDDAETAPREDSL